MAESRSNDMGKSDMGKSMERMAGQAQNAMSDAVDKASDEASNLGREAGKAWNAAKDAGRDAYRDVADRVSETVDAVRGTDMGDMVDDLRVMMRRNPFLYAGVAMVAGFCLARYMGGSRDMDRR